jgi:transposase
MLDVHPLKAEDLQGLDAETASKVAALVQRLTQELRLKETKLQKLTFELARLKALKFGAKSEAMDAEQRRLFEETLAEDEASLRAQLKALQRAKAAAEAVAAQDKPPARRPPRRQPLPEHLRREDHHHEPEDTSCPEPACGKPMQRIGEDVSERLDIVPAEFFVHRHIRGKWACKCCQVLVQQPVDPQIIDKGQPTAGLIAHTLVSRFVDHVPYYRQEAINARSGVHTPRSTLAAWSGAGGAALEPLYEVHKAFVLACAVLHADETPVAMLDPGAGKTKKAYIWGYARGEFDAQPGVIYEFCPGRGGK